MREVDSLHISRPYQPPDPLLWLAHSSASPFTTITSGSIVYRKGIRDGMYVIDFSYDGAVTWEEIASFQLDEDIFVINIDDGIAGYRQVIRDEALCIDHELYEDGFFDAEGVGWENVERYEYDWVEYWKSQNEVLFFGLYSEIANGQMPNKKVGATDFLTVSGTAGSETYQCPNTAPYIAADTDYIWFKTNEDQRTATTAELTGYDLQRSPIKYGDTSPNAIEAIIILNSAVSGDKLNRLFFYMKLPIFWNNSLNSYGHVKSNRLAQNLWTPEGITPFWQTDGNTVGWYDWSNTATITKDGGSPNDKISKWACALGTGHDIIRPGVGYEPYYRPTGVYFTGASSLLRLAFTYEQPASCYAVVRIINRVVGDSFLCGYGTDVGRFKHYVGSPNTNTVLNSGASLVNTTIGTTEGILRSVANGANSSIQWNEGTKATGNAGVNNPNGITLGGNSGIAETCEVEFKELIFRDVVDSEADSDAIYNYLKAKYSL